MAHLIYVHVLLKVAGECLGNRVHVMCEINYIIILRLSLGSHDIR